MFTRREFLKSSAMLGTASLVPPALLLGGDSWAQSATSALNPSQVPKFVNAMPNPLDPAFLFQPDVAGGAGYTLQITEFAQDLGLGTAGTPLTTVWGYGTAALPGTFPGRTFEVQRNAPITVTYVNRLVDAQGNPLPSRMPVDTTLDWANPGAVGGLTPVPALAHLHGGDTATPSDGLPDAWGTPFEGQEGQTAPNGGTIVAPQSGRLFAKPYTYDNAQEAGTLWYHDHAVGITRTNVYMGLAGFYLLRDDNENALRAAGVLPAHPYEVPVVVQDRLFTADGSLLYPATATGNLPNPTHLPEFFGDVIVVNGKAWPRLDVEPRKYRLRLLNGSDSRFYDMRFEVFGKNAQVVAGGGKAVPVLVIGTELGLLDRAAVPTLAGAPGVLPLGPGERYDIIVDFAGVAPGARVIVTNSARSPYPNAAKPAQGLTDRLMAFDVVVPRSAVPDATVTAATDLRPINGRLPPLNMKGAKVRRLMLFEGTDRFGRLQTMLGPVDPDPLTGQVGTLTFKDPITERPALGSREVWEFYNATVDAHPIHMHLVDFRIVGRQPFTATLAPKLNTDSSNGATMSNIVLAGASRLPPAHENGRKDTVQTFPGEVTRVLVSFNRPGEYVYHCHILSHEDHEMMRPYEVV